MTDDDYHWVCSTCFEDFRARFAWAVDPEGTRFELWEPPAAVYPEG